MNPLAILPTMEADLARTEQQLLGFVAADGEFLTEMAGHLIRAGGKRVRPGFALASAATLDPNGGPASSDVIRGGCAVELVHIGSLHHDDVMDDAVTRRSVKSVNAKWGNLRAILAGDYLLGRASEIAASLGAEVAGILATTITRLCEGQIRELHSQFDVERTVEDYDKSIEGKTAALLGAACRIGAIVGGLPRPAVESLTNYGHSYGMAFQVVDDILDLVSTEEAAGKPIGNDILEGTYTLPVIRALEDAVVGNDLRRLLTEHITPNQRQLAQELVLQSGSVQVARDVARSYADRATRSLSDLPNTPGTRALRSASTGLIDRATNKTH